MSLDYAACLTEPNQNYFSTLLHYSPRPIKHEMLLQAHFSLWLPLCLLLCGSGYSLGYSKQFLVGRGTGFNRLLTIYHWISSYDKNGYCPTKTGPLGLPCRRGPFELIILTWQRLLLSQKQLYPPKCNLGYLILSSSGYYLLSSGLTHSETGSSILGARGGNLWHQNVHAAFCFPQSLRLSRSSHYRNVTNFLHNII